MMLLEDLVVLTPSANRLLRALPQKLQPKLELGTTVELQFGETLCEAGAQFEHVYFPLDCSISMLVPIDDHPPLELGLIGCEGMLGASDTLGVSRSPWLALVQGAGSALRLTVKQFRTLQRLSPAWREHMQRYLHLQIVQQARITACSHYHPLGQRLARWLLMSLDRRGGDVIHYSHSFLADMLGVRRSAVTLAAGDLRRDKVIRYVRGEIHILDRHELEARACSCYRKLNDDDAAAFSPGADSLKGLQAS